MKDLPQLERAFYKLPLYNLVQQDHWYPDVHLVLETPTRDHLYLISSM